jgi:hypothetical protein
MPRPFQNLSAEAANIIVVKRFKSHASDEWNLVIKLFLFTR